MKLLAPMAIALLLALCAYHAPAPVQHTLYIRECTSHQELGCLPESAWIVYGN